MTEQEMNAVRPSVDAWIREQKIMVPGDQYMTLLELAVCVWQSARATPADQEPAYERFLSICSEELIRSSLTSLPLKIEFGRDRCMTLEQVDQWARDTRRMFRVAVEARLQASQAESQPPQNAADHIDAVAWQVRRSDGRIDGVPIAWESCTKDLYDATRATGRYAGYENGPRCEVRALRVIAADHIVEANKKVDAPTLNKLMWSDMSTASPVEKARRVLDHLSKQDSVYFFDDGFPRTTMMSDVRACLAVLNHLASVEAQSVRDAWISVDDRLPEIIEMYPGSGTGSSEPVLVYLADENDNGKEIAVWRCFRGGQGDTTTIHWDWNSPKVTHWQPLPAPPQKPVSEVT